MAPKCIFRPSRSGPLLCAVDSNFVRKIMFIRVVNGFLFIRFNGARFYYHHGATLPLDNDSTCANGRFVNASKRITRRLRDFFPVLKFSRGLSVRPSGNVYYGRRFIQVRRVAMNVYLFPKCMREGVHSPRHFKVELIRVKRDSCFVFRSRADRRFFPSQEIENGGRLVFLRVVWRRVVCSLAVCGLAVRAAAGRGLFRLPSGTLTLSVPIPRYHSRDRGHLLRAGCDRPRPLPRTRRP